MTSLTVAVLAGLFAAAPASARELAGIALPETAAAAGQTLVLNEAGERPAGARLEEAVLVLVNAHRRDRGLTPLVSDERITREARRHSAAMASGKTAFGHGGFDDRAAALRPGLTFRQIAENVASNDDRRDPAGEAVRGWLASRGHRSNIEGPYDRTGIGVASNAKGEVYFTQIFVGR